MVARRSPALLLALTLWGCAAAPSPSTSPAGASDVHGLAAADAVVAPPAEPDEVVEDGFATDVVPILRAACVPCHFPGGKMYDRLPFDNAATVRRLGERLFTRIEDGAERETIRRFLARPVDDPEAEATTDRQW